MKAIGGSLVTLVSWLGSFAISYSFSFLMDWSSAGNAPRICSPAILDFFFLFGKKQCLMKSA
jgi:SP family facilitated glucose transporter-like MFS transporter 8